MYFYVPVGVPVGPVSIIDLPESNTMVFNTVEKLLPVNCEALRHIESYSLHAGRMMLQVLQMSLPFLPSEMTSVAVK